MVELLQVGVITTTHGVRGEVKVFPTTDDPKRFKKLKTVLLDTGKEKRELHLESVKFFKQFVIIKFKEFQNMNEVEGLRQMPLLITRDQAVPCGENENFIADLIGLNVVTEEGEALGTLNDVLQTGANDVYVVKMTNGRELLIPAIRQCILDVNLDDGIMTVHLLEGLLDL
ncbi:MAG: ribosome maturation factor RimM [Clostridiales bacterium]|nr:ribosome maturation factor RimM [Clostridiales bacterium]